MVKCEELQTEKAQTEDGRQECQVSVELLMLCVLLGPQANWVLSMYLQWEGLNQVCKLRLGIPSCGCFPAWTSDSM